MAERIHNPLQPGSKRESIADPDAPSVFHYFGMPTWTEYEVEPHEVDTETPKEEDEDGTAD